MNTLTRSITVLIAASAALLACSTDPKSTRTDDASAMSSSNAHGSPDVDVDIDAGSPNSTDPSDHESHGLPPGDLAPAAEYVAGSRLHPIFLQTDEAQQSFHAFRDTLLDTLCTFRMAADQVLRCLPLPNDAKRVYLSGQEAILCGETDLAVVAWSDSECAQEVPRYFSEKVPGCSPYERVFALRPLTEAELATVHRDRFAGPRGTEACSSKRVLDEKFAREVGEVAPEMFVAASNEKHVGKGRVRARYIVAEDGAIARDGWLDAQLARPCDLRVAWDGSLRCMILGPITKSLGLGGSYEKPCTRKETYVVPIEGSFVPSHCPLEDAMALEWLPPLDRCTETFNPVELKPREPSGCFPGVTPQYERASRWEPNTLPLFRRESQGGRLKQTQYVIEETPAVPRVNSPSDNSWDSKLVGFCSFQRAVDGSLRCIPNTFAAGYFSDPGCTARVHVVRDDKPCEPVIDSVKLHDASQCSGGNRVFKLSSKVESGTTYALFPDGCDYAGTYSFKRLEREIAPDEMVSATYVER